MQTKIDHLVITSPDLPRGVAAIERLLGVSLQPGGEHPRMGTHNCLLRLGEEFYLEVIAVNPVLPAPNRPRWFGLDTLDQHSDTSLVTWVLQCSDIEEARRAAALPAGEIEPMSRGKLNWQITVPADGHLRWGGTHPQLIQWEAQSPVSQMPYAGCCLNRLDIYTADNVALDQLLSRLNFVGPVSVHALAAGTQAYVTAQIETPAGLRVLGGPPKPPLCT